MTFPFDSNADDPRLFTLSRLEPSAPLAALVRYGGFWFDGDSGLTMAAPPAIDSVTPRSSIVTPGVWNFLNSRPARVLVNEQAVVQLTAAEGDALGSNAPAANFAWMHKATGFTCFVVARSTGGSGIQAVFDNASAGNVNQSGVNCIYNRGTGILSFSVVNGVGTPHISVVLPITGYGLSLGTHHIFEMTWSEAAGCFGQCDDRSELVLPTISGSPSSSNAPPHSLTLGAALVSGLIQNLQGDIASIFVLQGAAPQETRDAIKLYFATRRGIPFVPFAPALAADLTSDPLVQL